jgi:DNA uptake protein ComE-like DNA-binding protein
MRWQPSLKLGLELIDWLSREVLNQLKSVSAGGISGQVLKAKVAADPYYRFKSVGEIQAAAAIGIAIDVNTATIDDWLRLPGISIHQARSLSTLIESGVQFYCIEDLAAVLGISHQRLAVVEPILQFQYYDWDSIGRTDRIDLNSADVDRLKTLPNIGPVLARAIVRHRTSHGPYNSLVDLQDRLNLPQETTAALMHYLKF